MQTCKNDGNEFTKGKQYSRQEGADNFADVEFSSPNMTSITYPTRFRTAEGTEVIVPAGAHIGQSATRMSISNFTAWDEYIEEVIAAESNMTEDQYWESQVAPASPRLMSLIHFTSTNISEVLPDISG
ncbi:hypothetical protein KCU89_g4059, partial [Aureobasidium melanogenum]